MNADFSRALLHWHQTDNQRTLPWKAEKDPYKIWLSEIILQQTRAEQGLPYYQAFIQKYPRIQDLADAPEDEVFRLWQGLGYYNRCKNMLSTAKEIAAQGGQFPNTYEGLLGLKGIGPYTAAAIASFAFGRAHAVVDGNVYRIISRYFGMSTAIDSTEGKLAFQQRAQELLPTKEAAAYNQAIMDFGASVCKPKNADCTNCPLSSKCQAYKRDLVALLPIKEKKQNVQQRHFHYIVLSHGDEVYIQQRDKKGIWPGLYEFPLLESSSEQLSKTQWQSLSLVRKTVPPIIYQGKQRLTHQLIQSYFYELRIQKKPSHLKSGKWIAKELIKNYAFPKTIISFLHRKKYF